MSKAKSVRQKSDLHKHGQILDTKKYSGRITPSVMKVLEAVLDGCKLAAPPELISAVSRANEKQEPWSCDLSWRKPIAALLLAAHQLPL